MLKLLYQRGSIVIKGDIQIPNSSWDAQSKNYRAMSLYYRDIVHYLQRSKIEFTDEVTNFIPCPKLNYKGKLRGYQKQALDSWLHAENKGIIILPTGSGKTVIAVSAIALLSASTLIVVPTLDLLEQWRKTLFDEFQIEIGVCGGGRTSLKPLTVSTYDSAYLKAEYLGNKFKFLVFDEVHHLPSSGYRQIAEMYVSPFRMGLTATYEREDDLHKDLPFLVGGKVFELEVQDLAGHHLSDFELERVYTDLTTQEEAKYKINYQIFKNYLKEKHLFLKNSWDFRRFIMRTGRDPKARLALLARNKALDIALNSDSKLVALKEILLKNTSEPTIIFTHHNKLVYRIAKQFFIPFITHMTPKEERKEILQNFRDGEYRIIVTSRVLDEGIDVPDATIAVILSGTGSTREFIQRLGRILRKKEEKKAKLIEIISRKTTELSISQRRRWKVNQNTAI